MFSMWNTLGTRIVAIGDFNSRHISWDRRTTTRGYILYNQCNMMRWQINAPQPPTCHTVNGESIIDLAISKTVEVSEVILEEKSMNKGSDHAIVRTSIVTDCNRTIRKQKTIPISQRRIERYIERAQRTIPRNLQLVKQHITNASTPTALENAYAVFRSTMLQPWYSARTTYTEAKVRDNNREITSLQRYRSKCYRKACNTKSVQDWIKYEEVNKQFRSIIRQWKRHNAQKKFERLAASTGTEMMKRLSSIILAKKIEKKKSGMNRTLDPLNFTKHVSTKQGRGHVPEMKHFHVGETFTNAVEIAIQKAPSGKATGETNCL